MRTLLTYTGTGTQAAHNLAVEAYLLETVPHNTAILYLWQNANTVVVGRNQNAWAQCNVEALEADGGFLARRLSGGGAVYHDLGNLNFTFLAAKGDFDVQRQTEVVLLAMRLLGLEAYRSGRNDLLIDNRKFSGNAFLEQRGKCYHHGTLLLNTSATRMQRYLNVDPTKLSRKGVDSVRSRVVNLVELDPSLDVPRVEQALLEAFGQVYAEAEDGVRELAEHPMYDGGPAGMERRDKRVAQLEERFSSWEWRLGRNMPFTSRVAGRYSWGGVEVLLRVECGMVAQARVYTDAMDVDTFNGVADNLVACHLDATELCGRITGDSQPRRDLRKLMAASEW